MESQEFGIFGNRQKFLYCERMFRFKFLVQVYSNIFLFWLKIRLDFDIFDAIIQEILRVLWLTKKKVTSVVCIFIVRRKIGFPRKV